MVVFRSVLATLFLGTAFISRPLVAQMGNATSVHTVSVTVPPRVKVQVSSFAVSTVSSTSSANATPAGGVAVRVTATQPWILSIGTAKNARAVKWSRTQQGDYAALSASQATVASGAHGTTSADATLFLSSDSNSPVADNAAAGSIVLTMAAR